MLYTMIAGKRPFESTDSVQLLHEATTSEPASLHTLSTDCSERLAATVRKAFRPKRDDRYRSAQSFQDSLSVFLKLRSASTLDEERDLSITLPRSLPPVRDPETKRWKRIALTLFGALLAMTMIAAIGWTREAAAPDAHAASQQQAPSEKLMPIMEVVPPPPEAQSPPPVQGEEESPETPTDDKEEVATSSPAAKRGESANQSKAEHRNTKKKAQTTKHNATAPRGHPWQRGKPVGFTDQSVV